MNCENIKENLVELLSNRLPENERITLEMHLLQCEGCREELEALRSVWDTLGHLPVPEPGEEMRVGFYSMLNAYKNSITASERYSWRAFLHKLFGTSLSGFRLAYGLGLFILGCTIGYWLNNPSATNKNYEQQISILSSEMHEMRQIMLLSLIENPSATERLKAVGYTKDLHRVNDRVIEALLGTFNNDPNVNVRLATLEALSELSSSPRVREGLVQSLTKQKSPLVQSALVDVMVMMQEKRSVQKLRQLLKDEDLNSLVKGKIEKTIQALS